MTKQDTLPPLEQERTAFEAWAKRRCFDLTILEDDDADEYKELETESAWESWQARAALAAQAPQPAKYGSISERAEAGLKQGLWAPQQAQGVAAWKPTAQQFAEWCETHDMHERNDRDAFFDAASLYLTAAPQAAPAPEPEADQHPDDKAVDRFAARMKWKLGQKRHQGRSGWQDRAWTPEMISQALREHVDKGDPLDVANYCMFLAARNEPITPAPAPQALTPPTDEQIAAAVRPLYRSDQAAKLGLDDDIRTVRAVFGIGAASAGGEG
jgi:hypothetical protein